MPSNDYQWTGWIILVTIILYVFGFVFAVIGLIFEAIFNGAVWVWDATFYPRDLIPTAFEVTQTQFGYFGTATLIGLFMFVFLRKLIFQHKKEPIPKVAILFGVATIMVYPFLYSSTYLGWLGLAFDPSKSTAAPHWFNVFLIIIMSVCAPSFGAMGLAYSVMKTLKYITLGAVGSTLATSRFIRVTVIETRDFIKDIALSIVGIWQWLKQKKKMSGFADWYENNKPKFEWSNESEEQSYERSSEEQHSDFDASRFKDSAPYGVDRHHPDDAKFWNIVNDPSAPEGEQINALSAIKKREIKRRGKSQGQGDFQGA